MDYSLKKLNVKHSSNNNNNNGYFKMLLLQRAHSPFIKNSVNIKLRKAVD